MSDPASIASPPSSSAVGALLASAPDRARTMAVQAHGEQRYGTRPYVYHLDQVAELVRAWGPRAEVVAYLHDALEDTSLTRQAIEDAFGVEVASLVADLTDDQGVTRKERKASTYARLSRITSKHPNAIALVVKAADRLANVRCCVGDRNTSLLAMYRAEHGAFRDAVFRSWLNDELVVAIDRLLAPPDAAVLWWR